MTEPPNTPSVVGHPEPRHVSTKGHLPGFGTTTDHCFICRASLTGVTVRRIDALPGLSVDTCGPCVDLPDTTTFVRRLISERLAPSPTPTVTGSHEE